MTLEEIKRIKPDVLKAAVLKRIKKREIQIIPFPNLNEHVYVETSNLKLASYLLDFYIAYQKPTLLLSSRQSGKTALLNHKVKSMLEMNIYRAHYQSLTTKTTLKYEIELSQHQEQW